VWTPPESGRTRVLSFVTKPWHPNQDNPTAGRQNMRPRLSPSVPRRCGRDAGQHTCVPAATASELETSEPGGEKESHRFCVQHQAYRPPDKNRDVLVARDAHTRARARAALEFQMMRERDRYRDRQWKKPRSRACTHSQNHTAVYAQGNGRATRARNVTASLASEPAAPSPRTAPARDT
jgi:hypothetical protein